MKAVTAIDYTSCYKYMPSPIPRVDILQTNLCLKVGALTSFIAVKCNYKCRSITQQVIMASSKTVVFWENIYCFLMG